MGRRVQSPTGAAPYAAGDAFEVYSQSPHDWSPDLQKSRVYEQILLDIVLGVLAPSARLDEQVLSERYGCGLAGVRDALGRLALEGLVQRRSRVGTTVTPLDLIDVQQAFEARLLIEPHCAALAAARATPRDIAAIRAAFEGAEAAIATKDYRLLATMDQAFHRSVSAASQNATLARMVMMLQHRAARYWIFSMDHRPEAERMSDVMLHRAVGEAIAAGDADRARDCMTRVLGDFPDSVRRALTPSRGAPVPA